MTVLAPLALFGWIPFTIALFITLPARRAAIYSFILGWLFLPVMAYPIPGFTDYTKTTAVTVGIFLATLAFDLNRFVTFRPHWVDIPAAVLCFWPFLSSISNGLGPYDGVSSIVYQTTTWGLPYIIGRLYLGKIEAHQELAAAIVLCALIYTPLVAWELRMSPQLHRIVYGFHPHAFHTTLRLGGWRPMVFMQHGLMLSVFILNAGMIAFWLAHRKLVRSVYGLPFLPAALGLLVLGVLCKSTGAIFLACFGVAVLFATRIEPRFAILALISAAPIWMFTRTTGILQADVVYDLVLQLTGDPSRAGSLGVRLDQEDQTTVQALTKPIFGHGGWTDGRDQLWLLFFLRYGIIYLTAFFLMLLLPLAALVFRMPRQTFNSKEYSATIVLSVAMVLYALDCLFNGMFNPVYPLISGGVAAFVVNPPWRSPTQDGAPPVNA